MSASIAPDLDEIQLSARTQTGAWARHGARDAANAYAGRSTVPSDEFLSWFLEVSHHRETPAVPDQKRMADALAAGAPTEIPLLPDASTLGPMILAWASSDAQLAKWLQGGLAPKQALARWGGRLLMSQQAVRGVEAFRAVTALDPQDSGSWTNLGVAYDLVGATAESAACLEHSLSLSPQEPDTWLQLGTVRRKRGESDRAEVAFRTALEQEPGNALAWQCLGLLKEAQSDFPGAIDCFLACVNHGGGTAALCANVGRLCYRIGRLVPAHQAYAEAVRLEPTNERFVAMERKLRFIRMVFEGASAEAAAASLGENASDLREIFDKAFGLLSGFGHVEPALRVARRSLQLWPAQPITAYLVKAMEGGVGVDRSPADYLVEHFDHFADQFESQLVGALGYDVPEKLSAMLRIALNGRTCEDVLDAGCGTGLCGPYLRPLARRLTGVDISPGMLTHAERRGSYHRLVTEDLVKFLGHSPRAFDLIVAADVVVYFGHLGPLLVSAAFAMRKGGLLAFSTETHDGEGYLLRPSGRFTHAPAYVERMALPEFALVTSQATTIRLEATDRVPGRLFIFRRL